jgi:autotransporter-associated beta strand protein
MPNQVFPKNPMNTKLIPLIVLCGFTLCALPSAAQIGVVNTGFLNNTSNLTNYTLSFNAGASANKLIVSAGTESAAAISSITYNGVALTLIPNTGNAATGRSRGIWYLDNPFSGGAANVVVTGTAALSHMRLGIASISGSAPGAAIGSIASAVSVSLNIPVNGSFVIAAQAANEVSPVVALGVNAPLTSIFSVTGDSAIMAAGYQNSVTAGPATYSFNNNNPSNNAPETMAAAFVPASAAPVIVGFSPANNATDVALDTNLVATFSEPVVAGTGNIELWQVGGGSPVESFEVASSPRLTFSGATLTINPTNDLSNSHTYYVLIDSTAVVDTSGGDAFAGIADPATWTFGNPPRLVSLNPADNATSFPVSSNLVATFSETVVAGTGNIELRQAGGSLVESFDVTSSSRLTFSGSTLTIDPTADLTPGVGYYILIDPTAVVDTSANAFTGISVPTAWNFTADSTGAIFDDFNTGNDSNWTRLSPLTLAGAPAVYGFPGGNRYQISSPVSPNPGLFGPARAGSLRLDQSYAAYFQQSVDLVDWDQTQSNLTMGMLARVSQPGLGTTDGYSLTVNLNGVFEINRITNEASAAVIATTSIGALNLANDYRFVFIGDGPLLIGQIFNLADLSTPLATISGIDATYSSGNSGLFVFTSTGTQSASATFDNYASGTFGTPRVKANNSNNLNLGTSWVGGVVPTFADRAKWDATVTGANTTSLGADLTWGGIVITNPAGPVIIDPGNTLSLGAGLVDIDLSAATQDLTLNCDLAMLAPNVWDVTSGRTLALGGLVSGSAGVTKQGAGTVVLSNANTYTGKTIINEGTLKMSGAGTPGAPGSSVAVSSGALLDLNGTHQSIAFAAGTGVGTVANNAGSGTSTLTLAGVPTINGSHVTIQDSTTTPGGKVAVVITGNTEPFNNLNTYSGGTTVNAGARLYLNSANPTGAGLGPIHLTAIGANAATSSGLLVDGVTYANDITGAGYVHNNSNAGATVVTTTFTGNINTSGPFIFRAGTGITYNFAGDGTTSSISGVIGSTTSLVNGAVVTGSVIKSGTGTLTLSGNNLYTGNTTVSGGTLVLQGGSQASPITVESGATLGFDIAAPTTSTKAVTLNAGHKIMVNGSPTLANYTLLTTTASISGTPNLDPAIPGYTLTVDGGNTLKLVLAPTNTFASWISNPAFGLSPADQDLGDDPDGDGIDNGVENFFGTNPGIFSQGLSAVSASGGTFTFTHPQNATPASDLTAAYTWSKDLATFLVNGATDGAGSTVSFTTLADTPSPGITTVTATVTGTAASKLFVRIVVTGP